MPQSIRDQVLKRLESIVSIDAVESFLKSLEFSDKCDEYAITLIQVNIRNFAWIIRNELERIQEDSIHD